jgi:hypothetical protein
LLMTFIYFFWIFISIINDNDVFYIFQDSLGFLLYIFLMPVVYLYIYKNNLEYNFFSFIKYCSLAISLFTFAFYLVLKFYFNFDSSSFLLINKFLFDIGLYWKIDYFDETLAIYSNVAHILLLGNAIFLYRYSISHKFRDLLIILLFISAIFLDGRRTLFISVLIQTFIFLPFIIKSFTLNRKILFYTLLTISISIVIFSNYDWLQLRFSFSNTDFSTSGRIDQVPALLDAIYNNPFFGGGFGSVASVIRSVDRPFSYEMDYLATIMKLGIVGAFLYFGSYLWGISYALRRKDNFGIFLFSSGLVFFLYMGANGNNAMSTDSATFHILLFLLIAFPHKDYFKKSAI